MHRFVALNRSLGSVEGPKPLAGVNPPFDCPVVLFDNVVQVGTGATATTAASFPAVFSSATTLGDEGLPSTWITLGRGWPGERKAFWKKRLAAAASRWAESRKSIVAPVESTARYK